ncbi:hypothetical protein DRJ22_04225, partial [Candidatus Woesearchaeota archaeon]
MVNTDENADKPVEFNEQQIKEETKKVEEKVNADYCYEDENAKEQYEGLSDEAKKLFLTEIEQQPFVDYIIALTKVGEEEKAKEKLTGVLKRSNAVAYYYVFPTATFEGKALRDLGEKGLLESDDDFGGWKIKENNPVTLDETALTSLEKLVDCVRHHKIPARLRPEKAEEENNFYWDFFEQLRQHINKSFVTEVKNESQKNFITLFEGFAVMRKNWYDKDSEMKEKTEKEKLEQITSSNLKNYENTFRGKFEDDFIKAESLNKDAIVYATKRRYENFLKILFDKRLNYLSGVESEVAQKRMEDFFVDFKLVKDNSDKDDKEFAQNILDYLGEERVTEQAIRYLGLEKTKELWEQNMPKTEKTQAMQSALDLLNDVLG